MGNVIARATGHIPSVSNGEDAVWYEIVPDTFAVSLDAEGNWAEGTNVVVLDGEERAQIFCTYIKHTGSDRCSPSETLVLTYGDRLASISNYTGFAYIRKSDTSVSLSLHTLNNENPPTYAGELLARITITVNRAGSNGTSVKAQFSVNGSDGWHDAYLAGDKYIRLWNGELWSAAIKFVGDDGNSFNTRGSVMRHYEKTSLIQSPVLADRYIVDNHDVGEKIGKPCRVEYVAGPDSSVEVHAEAASVGDAYVVKEDGSLWVANESEWVNLGQIQGPKGDSVTITDSSVKYAIASSGSNPPRTSSTDWKDSVQTVTADKPYLWTWTHVEYSDGNFTDSYSVTTRGNRGAVFRQHVGFVSEDYSYQSGSGTEEFIDVVKVGKVWYRCIKSYNSGETPLANDVTNLKYWSTSGVTNMDFVATQLLLAEDATINMLGTNEINLYDNESMFGSYRVPHGKEGVDGDADEGKYALWLGAKQGGYAPFSVTDQGALHSTSGSIGGFAIGQNNLHAEKDEMTFDIYHDRLVFVDNNNYRTVMIANSEDEGLNISLSEREEDRMCRLSVGTDEFGMKANVGLYASSTEYRGTYTQKSFSVGDYFGGHVFECVVYEPKAVSLVRIPAPKAGVKCWIDKTNNKATIILAGLPTKKPETGTHGTLYVENGFLKIWD